MKIDNYYLRLFLALTLTALLVSACGSNNENKIYSATSPTIFYAHSIALRDSSTVSWGVNLNGQLGNGLTDGETKSTPVLVVDSAATGMSGVSMGGTHSLAFVNNGNVFSWGNNGLGQLGDNSDTSPHSAPVGVLDNASNPIGSITAVSAGGSHSLALDSSGLVWSWGSNYQGQLGIDTATVSTYQNHAAQITGLTGVSRISAGKNHSLAISGGQAMSWGDNTAGELGITSTASTNWLPTNVVIDGGGNLTGATEVAAGGSHSLFIASNVIWACGYNRFGQLGLGGTDTTDRKNGVVQVTGLPAGKTPIAVAAGLDHSLALMNDGTVYAWGLNFYGQLGNGAQLYSVAAVTIPVQVMKEGGTALTGIEKVVAIGNHNLAVDSSGHIWVWGENSNSQLGIAENDVDDRNVAIQLPPSTAVYDF